MKSVRCRRDVRKAQIELDPNGVNLRGKRRLYRQNYRTKGLNYVWQIDCYHKLTPSGFSIHDSINGYSRKVISFEVDVTNKVPNIIAKHHLVTVSIHAFSRFVFIYTYLYLIFFILICLKKLKNIHSLYTALFKSIIRQFLRSVFFVLVTKFK